MLYEALLLVAILFFATFLFVMVLGSATEPPARYILQAYLWLVAGCYLVWSWRHGGQTLAMQTWRIRVTNRQGGALDWRQACLRYVIASVFFGVGFVWALFDREGLYLHDRLTGCRLQLEPPKRPAK
jgi:uncharacterized RDD family membrane protein YckC